MPPKKAKVVAIPSLEGCAIAFASNSISADALSGRTLADAKTLITNNGGTYVTKVDDCSHLVVSETQYKKGLTKIEAAKSLPNVHIVAYDWLEKAFTAKSPVDENDYVLHDRIKQPAPSKNGTSKIKDAGDEDDKKPAKGTKRKRDPDAGAPIVPQPDAKSMNVNTNLDLNIPLDDVLMRKEGSGYKVHIGDDSTIFDVTLNQSDSGANANKFYRMQLLKDVNNSWFTWTRWGRVGEDGQCKMLGDGGFDLAMKEFEKKFKDKTGNTWDERSTGPMRPKKYVFIERSYEDSDSDDEQKLPGAGKRTKVKAEEDADVPKEEVKSKLPEPVQRLLKLIFNQEYFNNTFEAFDYDAQKMPLGKLSKTTLMRGYDVLKTLSTLVGTTGNTGQIQDLSNQYLSIIPHIVSRSSRPPVLDSMDMVKREIELLEVLTDMQLANNLMKDAKKTKEKEEEINLLDRQFQGLGMQEMDPLNPKSNEFLELEKYLIKSVGHTHGTNYKVQDIFRIKRNGEHDRFDQSDYAKIQNKNRRLLWHGSRATNFGGILSQGLRIAPPEAPVSGYMFGKGVYLADMSSKSANYCASYNTGNTGLLLLCEAELGEPPLKLTGADYNAGDKAKEAKCLSTWGVGRTAPLAWKDGGSVHESLRGVQMPDVVGGPPGPTSELGAHLQYNEFIVYDVAQIKLRYLFRVSM